MDGAVSIGADRYSVGPSLKVAHKTRYLVDDSAVWDNGRLSYIGQDCHCIPPILGRIYGEQARKLDLSFNSIRTLEHLEAFTNLEELILDNNSLHDNTLFVFISNLQTLSLNKNKFTDLYRLIDQISQCYPKLSYLSLLGNPACPDQLSNVEKDEEDYQRYRYYVIYRLPELRFLDSRVVTPSERRESLRVGPFMKVIRPKEDSGAYDEVDAAQEAVYTPLPSTSAQEGSHRGAFGQLRYRYSGKHSEGNRFILNNDL